MKVERDYPTVRSLLPEHFDRMLRHADQVVVLDVRDADEFGVSHVPGAERVDPAMTATEFAERFAERLPGKVVVLYCSVGVRSSVLARRIDAIARRSHALGVFNLRGGVFAWHNTGRRLEDVGRPTALVHGYDRNWSRFLDFDNYAPID
jgi:rhodanese-related sulfurtransferase